MPVVGGVPGAPERPRPELPIDSIPIVDYLCDGTDRYEFCPSKPGVPAPTSPGAPEPPPAPAAPPPPTFAEVAAWAQAGSTRLQLPVPGVQLGPDPSVNEWDMLIVGVDLWLWTDTWQSLTSAVSVAGHTLTLAATPGPITFDMGDGTVLTCASTTPMPPTVTRPGTPSPVCGHKYLRRAATDAVTITATQTWTVAWSGAGHAGSFPLTRQSARTERLGELRAVVNG